MLTKPLEHQPEFTVILLAHVHLVASQVTVKPVYSGHLGTNLKCPDFPGQFTCKWERWDHHQVP